MFFLRVLWQRNLRLVNECLGNLCCSSGKKKPSLKSDPGTPSENCEGEKDSIVDNTTKEHHNYHDYNNDSYYRLAINNSDSKYTWNMK